MLITTGLWLIASRFRHLAPLANCCLLKAKCSIKLLWVKCGSVGPPGFRDAQPQAECLDDNSHSNPAPAFLSAPIDYEVYDAPVPQRGTVRSSPPFGTVGLEHPSHIYSRSRGLQNRVSGISCPSTPRRSAVRIERMQHRNRYRTRIRLTRKASRSFHSRKPNPSAQVTT